MCRPAHHAWSVTQRSHTHAADEAMLAPLAEKNSYAQTLSLQLSKHPQTITHFRGHIMSVEQSFIFQSHTVERRV